MEGLYLFTCFIGVVVQIYSLVIVKKIKDKKYWNIFTGISIAGFISVVMAYIALESAALGLGDGILCLIVMAISFGANLIILIIGLTIKKRIQDDSIQLNKSFLLVSILVLVIHAIELWGVPALTHKMDTNKGKKIVIDYLEDKYGAGNYKVLNVYNEYTSNGIVEEDITGYYYEIKSSHMDNTFFVLVDNYDYSIWNDYFLPVYFSQKYNLSYELKYHEGFNEFLHNNFSNFENYLIEIIEENYPSDVGKITPSDIRRIYGSYIYTGNGSSSVPGYSSNFDIIPSDFGRIPTIEEMADRAYMYLK